MLKRRHNDGKLVAITVDGEKVEARAGESVAAAVLAHADGAPRAPYCMMGVCFECLMEIDGQPNRQACMVRVRDGMTVKRQQGARDMERAS